MSQMIDFTVPSTVPGRSLHAFRCVPDGEVKAILQLSNGMVEFIDRYKPLAEYLAGRGILVTGHDHLGHGGSIRTRDDYGYFAEPDGNRAVLADLHAMTVRTKELYLGVPYFLLGHSMGSFYARQYLCEYGHELDGAIIMGTGFQPKALVQFAKTLCRVLAVFHGWHYRSNFVAHTSFLGYNKGLEGRTTHDWLNRDHAEVDKYLADERCTFTFTLNAYYICTDSVFSLPSDCADTALWLSAADINFSTSSGFFSSATWIFWKLLNAYSNRFFVSGYIFTPCVRSTTHTSFILPLSANVISVDNAFDVYPVFPATAYW